jgi:hypothetical protein
LSKAIWVGPLLAIVAAAVLTAAGAAGTAAPKQRIAIEQRVANQAGTFKLIPLAPGPIKADSGKLFYTLKPGAVVTTLGQRATTYTVKQTLRGKRGVIQLTGVTKSTDAGSGYLSGSGTWSVADGTRAYAGLRGSGRESGVLTPAMVFFTRYEGYVTLP